MALWAAMYQIDCEICMSVKLMRNQLATVPVLKVTAKLGNPDLPDLPNQPTTVATVCLKMVWQEN